MPLAGNIALVWAVILSSYMVVASCISNRSQSVRLRESVRGAAVAEALSVTTAVFILEVLLMSGDYSVRAVYDHSSQTLPLAYKIGALWGGNSGSILFWGWILSLFSAWVTWRGWYLSWRMTTTVMTSLGVLQLFFSLLSLVAANPFALVHGIPTNGAGLDPLLRNPVMVIHPPAMYAGLVGMTIPAAYMLSALWHRVPWGEWVPVVRRWMLFSWLCLGSALVLGGLWAYMELGWGGYWEWDPVENAALLPWLTATAFLHALQMEERRHIFRWWTAGLGAATFLLTLIGTYITRSGVLKNSVHAFTGSDVGPYLAALLGACTLVVVFVFWLRRDMLLDPRPAGDGVGKESLYLLMNVTSSAVAVIVLLGTFYPIISRLLLGQTVVLTQTFFNASTVPLFLLLILAMGAGPALAWDAAVLAQVLRELAVPIVAGSAAAMVMTVLGYIEVMPTVAVGIIIFAATSMLREYWRAGRLSAHAHRENLILGFVHAVGSNRRRYGGYLVHLAVLVMALGVVGSHTGAQSVTRTLRPGQVVDLGGYRLKYDRLAARTEPGRVVAAAQITVRSAHGSWVAHPGLFFYPSSAEPMADVSIHQGLMKDVYLVLEGATSHDSIMLEAMINPMVSWIWLALPCLAAGVLLALSGGDAPPMTASKWERRGMWTAPSVDTRRNSW